MQHLKRAMNLRYTPQSEQALPTQVPNNAGGYVWQVSDLELVRRFLILGTEGGTYYVREKTLTTEMLNLSLNAIRDNGEAVVEEILAVSQAGRAYKNDYALFLLAASAAVGNLQTRRAALIALPKVARTATHLFQFLEYTKQFRGWGRALKGAVAAWYDTKGASALAYQMVKYRSRNGWTHRDVLRKAHPKAITEQHAALYDWACHGTTQLVLPEIVTVFNEAIRTTDVKKVVELLTSHPELPWETLNTQVLTYPEVWKALLPNLPYTALIRNIGRMTANGAITPFSKEEDMVVAKLGDAQALKAARVHPLQLFVANRTYSSGSGTKGSLTWDPVGRIEAALETAFYDSFQTVVPTGKRFLLGLDVSGSMSWDTVCGISNLTPMEASALMALTTLRVESNCHTMAFQKKLVPLRLHSSDNFSSAWEKIREAGEIFGATDCSQPMLYALKHRIPVDCFIVYTDSETWAGEVHPHQALAQYRSDMGINAKSIVVAMSGSPFTIANPSDAGMLDVVGFDTNTPQVISEFAKL